MNANFDDDDETIKPISDRQLLLNIAKTVSATSNFTLVTTIIQLALLAYIAWRLW